MRKISYYILALGLSVGLLGCGNPPSKVEEGEQTTEEGGQVAEEEADSRSYLTGLEVPQSVRDSRPLAVMLNNIKAGCPQSGTADAAIIYEAPVEGRITRLMGIFEDYEKLDNIGSIRSSRDYFVYFAREYEALYVHFGQATPYVGELLNSDRVDNISGNVPGIDRPAPNSFVRSSKRKAPHNVYLVMEGVLKDIERFKYPTKHSEEYVPKFTFADIDAPETYEGEKDALVLYPGGKTNTAVNGFSRVQARFEYNEEDGLYYRYQYGDKHIDELTGEQLAVTNVVFQYCHGEVRDENDYLAFGCHGNDGHKVQVFTQGKMVEGTWKRELDELPASYLDKDGNPIVLNPGKTWVCIVWDEYGDDVVIE